LRKRKYHVEIWDWQQLGFPCCQPLCAPISHERNLQSGSRRNFGSSRLRRSRALHRPFAFIDHESNFSIA
jgi:hypothetical protein